MIEQRAGDIFEQKDIDYIIHQCNLFWTFGSGIAAEIKKRFPWAYEADCKTVYGSKSKLGWFSIAEGKVGIVNIYSQNGISATHRQTNYAAMGKALFDLEGMYNENKVVFGIPFGIGCGLGGGDWKVVRPIIESAFGESPVRVVICKLPK